MDEGIHPIELKRISTNGIVLNVATAGSGPDILLLHGWPHTWFLWRAIIGALADRFTLIAPDMRGIGDSTKTAGGYDIHTLSDDIADLLDALDVKQGATVVGIDAGVSVAWALAMRYPDRVDRVVLMEGLVGSQPGAEAFLARGAPWWFGFHMVSDFAERLLEGREADYLDYFYTNGTFDRRGIASEARSAFLDAYAQPDAMRCGFEYYRAIPCNARLIAALLDEGRVKQPTLAIGGNSVGDALRSQLAHMCDDLEGVLLERCGHIIPEDRPRALSDLIGGFAAKELEQVEETPPPSR